MESVDKMDSLADTVHGAVEIADSLQTANEQAKLVENFDNEISNNNEIATVDNILNQTDENFDIDFGKIGNFIVKCGINLILPFVNGMMMGFGEILAHELCFRHNWTFARVSPVKRMEIRHKQRQIANSINDKDSILLQ